MTSEGWKEILEGDFADTSAEKFPLVWLGDEWNRQARTPIGASAILLGCPAFTRILSFRIGLGEMESTPQ